MHDVFSEPWVAAWAAELEESEAYRKAAATWEGSIALRITDADPGGAHGQGAVLLDLWHGECREAETADAAALADADYLLEASIATWKKVLDGQLEPIFGLMTGQLKLARGSVAALTPYMNASKELVAAASRVPTHWP